MLWLLIGLSIAALAVVIERAVLVISSRDDTARLRSELRRLLPEVAPYPIYVTIDIDVLDPSEAPGTGSPEPCGLRVAELIEIVHLLGGARVIGGDLVEVAHAWDPSGRTGIAAAWVIREAMLTWWGHVK